MPEASGLRRSAVVLAGGALGSQLILVLGTVLLGRIYSPASFGGFAIVSSTVAILAPLATLRIEVAVPPAGIREDAWGLARYCLFAVGASTAIGMLVVAMVAASVGLPRGQPWVLTPLLLATLGVYATLSQSSLRLRRYGPIARRGMLQSSGMVAGQALLGLRGATSLALAVGELLGRLLGVVALWPSFGELKRGGVKPPQGSELWARYGGVVKHFLPASLLDVTAVSGVVVLVGWWFGSAAAGRRAW